MFNIGPPELLVVLLIALVVVGPRRLPEIGRQVGRALHDFRKVQTEVKDAIRFDLDAEEPPTKPASWSPPEVPAADEDAEDRARSRAAGERAEQRAAERAAKRARRTEARTPAPAEAVDGGVGGDATEEPREEAPGDVAGGSGAPPSPNGSTAPPGEPG